jgi:hypothetical protein
VVPGQAAKEVAVKKKESNPRATGFNLRAPQRRSDSIIPRSQRHDSLIKLFRTKSLIVIPPKV